MEDMELDDAVHTVSRNLFLLLYVIIVILCMCVCLW